MEDITVENPVIDNNKDCESIDVDETYESWSVQQFAEEVTNNYDKMQEYYDDIKLIKSSHMVLLKLDGFMSFNIPSDVPILFGGKERDMYGKFKEDGKDGRFLILFYDRMAFLTVVLSVIVLLGEIFITFAIVNDLWEDNCGVEADGPNSSGYALLLCSMYAAHVANERLGGVLPIEYHGFSFPALVALKRMRNQDSKDNLKDDDYRAYFKEKFDTNEQNEIAELVKPNYVTYSRNWTVVFMFGFLEIINIYVLFSVGLLMATSNSTLSLIQNFISVEIVLQFHEIVPLAFNIADPFPKRYNVSLFEASNLMITKFDMDPKGQSLRVPLYAVWFGVVLYIYWQCSYSCNQEE